MQYLEKSVPLEYVHTVGGFYASQTSPYLFILNANHILGFAKALHFLEEFSRCQNMSRTWQKNISMNCISQILTFRHSLFKPPITCQFFTAPGELTSATFPSVFMESTIMCHHYVGNVPLLTLKHPDQDSYFEHKFQVLLCPVWKTGLNLGTCPSLQETCLSVKGRVHERLYPRISEISGFKIIKNSSVPQKYQLEKIGFY